MIGHVTLGTNDFDKARAFDDTLMAPMPLCANRLPDYNALRYIT